MTSVYQSHTTNEEIIDFDTFSPFCDDLHFQQLHGINIDLIQQIVGRFTTHNSRRSLRRYVKRTENIRIESEFDQIISEFQDLDRRISELQEHDRRIAEKYDRHCRRRALPDSSRLQESSYFQDPSSEKMMKIEKRCRCRPPCQLRGRQTLSMISRNSIKTN